MNNAEIELNFLNKIRDSEKITNINKSQEDMISIIRNLEYMEELDKIGGPDYAYNKYFFEKFSIDSSKRKMNKNNKSFSKIKVINNKIEKSSEYESKIFNTLTFAGEDVRTNIRYMRENLQEMIKQKLDKKEQYKKNYSKGKIFGLIIEIEDYCKVFTNDKGEYFSSIDTDTSNLTTEHYEIYRDYNLMSNIKKRFSANIDILIFVESISYGKVHVACIDLRNNIKSNEMKNYPNRILQLCNGTKKIVKTSSTDNTNIQYKCNELIHINEEEIQIDKFKLKRTNEPNVYGDDKEMLFYETTQHKIALSPKITKIEFLRYFNLLIKEKIELIIQNNKYVLIRVSPLMSYMRINLSECKGVYRINKYKGLNFNFEEIGE